MNVHKLLIILGMNMHSLKDLLCCLVLMSTLSQASAWRFLTRSRTPKGTPADFEVQHAIRKHQRGSLYHTARLLSSDASFLPTVTNLYRTYGEELVAQREVMRPWCRKSQSCKFCDDEVEMLYMLIRELQPVNMFEMAPNRGYSTSWILAAMDLNKFGSLTSFDLHNASLEHVPSHPRWTFVMTNVRTWVTENTLDSFDFVFIDALHTEEFSSWYVRNLLDTKRTPAQVVIHDIVDGADGSGRESLPVYLYLAFTGRVHSVFTMARGLMPNPYSGGESTYKSFWDIRYRYGLVSSKYGGPGLNWTTDADFVYFKCLRAPSIYFTMNAK